MVGCFSKKTYLSQNYLKKPKDYKIEHMFNVIYNDNGEKSDSMQFYYPYHLLISDRSTLIKIFNKHLNSSDIKGISEEYKFVNSGRLPEKNLYEIPITEMGCLDYFFKSEMNVIICNLMDFKSKKVKKTEKKLLWSNSVYDSYYYEIGSLILTRSERKYGKIYCKVRSRHKSEDQNWIESFCVINFSEKSIIENAIFFYDQSFYFIQFFNDGNIIIYFDLYSCNFEKNEGGDEIMYGLKRYHLIY